MPHESVLIERNKGDFEGLIILNEFNGKEVIGFETQDLWQPPNAYGGSKLITTTLGEFYQNIIGNNLSGLWVNPKYGEFYGHACFVVGSGKPIHPIKCYRAVDRLALLAIIQKPDGMAIPHADVVFIGNVYKEFGKTNEHGIAGGYLFPDNYNNTLIISKNGIVYKQEKMEDLGGGAYRILAKRITIANVPFRQLHRKFD